MIGITGQIGAGKSAVSNILRDMGYIVYDTDSSVKALCCSNVQLKDMIDSIIPGSVNEDNTINTEFLKQAIFNNSELNKKLCSAIDPFLTQNIMHIYPDYVEGAVFDLYPLASQCLDKMWIVVADPDIRLNRLVNNRKMSESDARLRMQIQQKYNIEYFKQYYRNCKPRIIRNDGTLETLKENIITAMELDKLYG